MENAVKFCDGNLNKFVLLIKKGVYLYKFISNWGKFEQTSLPKIEYFCSNLNFQTLQNLITNIKNVSNTFKMKNLGDYYKLYVQRDTFLLCDVFKKFREMCLSTYGFEIRFVSIFNLDYNGLQH